MKFFRTGLKRGFAWMAGLIVVIAVAGWLLFQPMMVMVGAEVTGAPTTIDPSVFEPPEALEGGSPMGDGLIGPALSGADGELPDKKVLEQKLSGLDVSKLAAEAEELELGYQVLDAETGDVLAEHEEDLPLIPASTTKLLTVTAAMAAFEDTERFATRVVQPEAGSIVLVGGGDPMLTSVPVKDDTYPVPASLEELASGTAEALLEAGVETVKLGFDESLFTEEWNETWPEKYRDQVTAISALWADEGRDANNVRSREPALLAASTFASQLEDEGITVTGKPKAAAADGDEIARVESLPLHVLAEQAMLASNNSYTEVLGRQVGVRLGEPGTFKGAVTALEKQLDEMGLWDSEAVLHDTSGLSRENRITPGMLAATMRHVATEPRLSVILEGLPVAGVTGSLANRFGDPMAAPARAIARAKTGTLSFVSSLVGTTVTQDGREVVFAFVTNGSADGWAAQIWTEQGVGLISGCGC